MDIICPVCGEPWDHDELHERAAEVGETYAEVAEQFRTSGCKAFGADHGECDDDGEMCEWDRSQRALAAQAMYEACGDDMDGAASLLDDLAWMLG